jgi:hypothetical protein
MCAHSLNEPALATQWQRHWKAHYERHWEATGEPDHNGGGLARPKPSWRTRKLVPFFGSDAVSNLPADQKP